MRFKFMLLFLIIIITIYILMTDDDNVKKKKKVVVKKRSKKSKKLILYWANWCGVCKMIKPKWDEAKEILKKKYPKLKIEEINCDNYDEKKAYIIENGKKESLDGIPTIIIRDGINDVEYIRNNNLKGDRSVDDLVKFYEINK